MKKKLRKGEMKSPMECNSERDLAELVSDHRSTRDYWISHNGKFVTITKQRSGHSLTESIRISTKQFNQLIKWYTTSQKIGTL